MRSYIRRLSVVLMILILFSACGVEKQKATLKTTTQEERIGYLDGLGYDVIESQGISDTYTLSRELLSGMPYAIIWGLQDIDIDNYFGNEINVYVYIICNHPLDVQSDKKRTKIWLITSGDMIIGGCSMPDCTVELFGFGYALDGRTLEEVTGLSYKNWYKGWMSEYQ